MSLRPMLECDLDFVLKWRNLPDVRRNMYTSHEISWDEHRSWFANQQNDPSSCWLIHEDDQKGPDGVVYFTNILSRNNTAFWGFYAGANAVPGSGVKIAFEAIEWGFYVMNIRKLNCEVLAFNRKVINQHEKFGFMQEGCFREEHFDGEKYINVIRFGMLSKEWSLNREKIRERIDRMRIPKGM